MDQRKLHTQIAAAVLIDTPQIAANLGAPIERVRAEVDQMRATLRNLKAQGQPGQQRSQRWLKFTLRGLILLTLGVSLFLGGRAARQREIDGIRAERDEATNRLRDARMQAEDAMMQAVQAKVRAMKGD